MKDVSLEAAPTTKSGADAELIGRARAVLEANWLGHGTSPSLQLYPHQWSWDAACIAMGYASWNQSRAEQELRSLFAGQWRNGLLPHIVFTEGATLLPGPGLLGDRALAGRSRAASDLRNRPASDPRDGGVAGVPPRQPTAAGDGVSRRALPAAPVVARVPLPRALPERGRPRRDLAPVGVGDGQLPALGRGARADVARPGEHPGVRARRRARSRTRRSARPMASTTATSISSGCSASSPTSPRGSGTRCPSRSSRCSSTRSSSARTTIWPRSRASLGSDADPFEALGREHGAGLESLWDDEQALYVDYDVIADEAGRRRDGSRSRAAVRGRARPRPRGAHGRAAGGLPRRVGDSGWAVTSLSPADPGFQPTRYWRGPVWPILNWVLQRGLERYGYRERAEQVRQASRRARPERGVLGALRPAHRQGARRRAVRLDGRSRPRPPPGRRSRRESWGRGH